MAAAFPEDMEPGDTDQEIDENLLVCGICSERHKNAKLLPCLHSFCEECLRRLVEVGDGLKCPLCRSSHAVPDGGVSSLQGNDFLNGLIQSLNMKQGNDAGLTKCQLCKDKCIDKMCTDCSLTLCASCVHGHGIIPATKEHCLVPLAEYESSKVKHAINQQSCEIHTACRVKYYCDTCLVSGCSECMMTNHREHEKRDLQEAVTEYTEFLNNLLGEVKVTEKKASDRKKTVEEMLKAEDEHYEREAHKIKEFTQQTMQAVTRKLEENEKVLLEDLKRKHEATKTALNAKMKELDCVENDCSSAREFAEAVKHHGNATELMSVREGMTSRLEKLVGNDDELEPCEFVQFQQCGDLTDFIENNKLGELATYSYKFKDVPEFARLGDEINVMVTPESQQKIVNVSEADIQVVVSASNDETVAVTVTDNRDGTFSLRWHAATEGLYEVSVSVCGKPIGSTAKVKVIPKKGLLYEFKGHNIGGFNSVLGVVQLSDDTLMICDHLNNIVKLGLNDKSEVKETLCVPSTVAGQSYYAAVSKNGLIYITHASKVVIFDKTKKFIRCFGKGEGLEPLGITIHPSNNRVYVVDGGADCVKVYTQDGVYIFSFGHGFLKKPRCITFDNDSNAIVSAEKGEHFIQVFKSDGQFKYSFPNSLGLSSPEGIAVDKCGYVYICDFNNNRVVKTDIKGKFVQCIAEVKSPMGICVTNDIPLCKVIVADDKNMVVKVFAQ